MIEFILAIGLHVRLDFILGIQSLIEIGDSAGLLGLRLSEFWFRTEIFLANFYKLRCLVARNKAIERFKKLI